MEEFQQDPETGKRGSAFRIALRWLSEALETVVPAVLIALLINLFLAQATRVYGQSMEPNLHSDQRLVVEKLSYNFHEPRRGDIVVLQVSQARSGLLIKRVVGLAGEKVEIKDGRVYINEQPLEEPYISQQPQRDMRATVVPPKHVFVLGDNRGFSNDSRSFGPVPLDNIVGRAWFSYWPLDEIGFVE
ncbi:MAG: signal peptidase I [Chloroflexi bacterium]|nr:signal peptidase I [Chloroflexota bacterium]